VCHNFEWVILGKLNYSLVLVVIRLFYQTITSYDSRYVCYSGENHWYIKNPIIRKFVSEANISSHSFDEVCSLSVFYLANVLIFCQVFMATLLMSVCSLSL